MWFLVALFLVPTTDAAITADLNCTTYNGTAFVYAPTATVCNNLISDQSCNALYPTAPAGGPLPAPGTDIARPDNCFTTTATTPQPFSVDMKNAALQNCPKTCGYCCQTSAYSCSNAINPRLNCLTITNSQCNDPNWRAIIAQDCPAACGLCNEGGCVDSVPDCNKDTSICNSMGLQDFVNRYCQRTCNRCPSTTASSLATASSGTGTGTCTSFIADTSANCRTWAANGFCTNTFYQASQRRQFCATTCRIC